MVCPCEECGRKENVIFLGLPLSCLLIGNHEMETTPSAPQTECETQVTLGPEGLARVVITGNLSTRTAVDCWNKLERSLRGANVKRLEVDVRGVDFCGGAGFALLRY